MKKGYKGYRLNRRQPKSEAIKRYNKLYIKYKEYSEKTLQELEEMLPILNAGYKKVCMEVMRDKFILDLKSKQTEEITEGEV